MNTPNTKLITLGFAAAALAALAATAAVADPLPHAAAEQAGRCVAAVRTAVLEGDTTRIRHTITGTRTVGVRREFIIESAVFGRHAPAARAFTSRCLAERWGAGAELVSVRSRLDTAGLRASR